MTTTGRYTTGQYSVEPAKSEVAFELDNLTVNTYRPDLSLLDDPVEQQQNALFLQDKSSSSSSSSTTEHIIYFHDYDDSLLYFLEQDSDKNTAAAGQNSGGKMENSFIQSLLLHSNTNVQQQHQQSQQQQQDKVQPAEDNFYEDIETQSYEIEQSTERPKATMINYSTIKPYHEEPQQTYQTYRVESYTDQQQPKEEIRSYPKQQQQYTNNGVYQTEKPYNSQYQQHQPSYQTYDQIIPQDLSYHTVQPYNSYNTLSGIQDLEEDYVNYLCRDYD
jgi:hypothetical protein